MPWIISGKSKCKICGQLIKDEDEIVSFPPLPVPEVEYKIFSNVAMHRTCFLAHPLKDKLIKWIKNTYDPNDAAYGAVLLNYVADLEVMPRNLP